MPQNSPLVSSPFLARFSERSYRSLRSFLVICYIALIMIFLFSPAHPYIILGAILIASSAILPVIIWIETPVQTIPLLPAYTMPFLWYYAFPLVIEHPALRDYEPLVQLKGATWVALSAAIPTLVWWLALKAKLKKVTTCKSLNFKKVEGLLLLSSLVITLYSLALIGRWIYIPVSVFPFIRSVVAILSTISFFLLSYLSGANQISAGKQLFFFLCFFATALAQASSLILIQPASQIIVGLIGFTLGKRKPPLMLATFSLALLVLLHLGKYDMRNQYWQISGPRLTSVSQLPFYYFEWFSYSFNHVSSKMRPPEALYQEIESEKESRNLLERICLISQFLDVYTRAGSDVPYLKGQTYEVVPKSLVPRMLDQDKVSAHEAALIMNRSFNAHLGPISPLTHVAWGILAEAWANYGAVGLIALAGLVGTFIAFISRLSANRPLTSFANCLAICLLPLLFNGESTLAIKVTGFFHTTIALYILSLFYSERVQLSQDL